MLVLPFQPYKFNYSHYFHVFTVVANLSLVCFMTGVSECARHDALLVHLSLGNKVVLKLGGKQSGSLVLIRTAKLEYLDQFYFFRSLAV